MIRTMLALLLTVVVTAATFNVAGARTTLNSTQTQALRGGNHSRSGYWTKMTLTKYCQTGKTAWGTYTHWGSVSSTFRFGTHFNIPGYSSWATAEDTGSLVGNGHLDLYDPYCWGDIHIWGTHYNAPVFVYYR